MEKTGVVIGRASSRSPAAHEIEPARDTEEETVPTPIARIAGRGDLVGRIQVVPEPQAFIRHIQTMTTATGEADAYS